MPSRINSKFIDSLIRLGLTPEVNAVSIGNYIEILLKNTRTSAYHWESWHEACDELSVVNHIALFKGLLFAEYFTGWGRGSVSPVIWIYHKLSKRLPHGDIITLCEWAEKYSNNHHHPFFNGRIETDCDHFAKIFFEETKRIWAYFDVPPRRIIPLCTPVYQRPPALVIGTNHSVFTERVSLAADLIGNRMATAVPTVNTFTQHSHTFSKGLRAACSNAGIPLGYNWVGTNRCAVQTGSNGVKGIKEKSKVRFEECQQRMDVLLRNFIRIILPRNVILAGRHAIELYYPDKRNTCIKDLDCLDIGSGKNEIRIIPIHHPSRNTFRQKIVDRLKDNKEYFVV